MINKENLKHTADCQSSETIPQNLKDCVAELQQQTVKAKTVVESRDRKEIVGCANDLELTGHRAEMALQDAKGVDEKIQSTLLHAQSELLDLKKKLH